MFNKRYTVLYFILALIPMIYLLTVYGDAPDVVPTSFNMEGVAEEFGGKITLFVMPVVTLAIALISVFTPFLTKLSKQKDGKDLNIFAKFNILLIIFFDIISLNVIYTAINYVEGRPTDLGSNLMYLIFAFFIISGLFMPKMKYNSIIGIRTPYTLMDEEIWIKTHSLGGKIWVLCGIVGLVLTYIMNGSFWVTMGIILGSVLIIFIYSAILYYRKR